MRHKFQYWLSSVVLLMLALLSGCSTVTKDGPPPYDVDVSKIPNATPKDEALSKYGNMPVYRVNGHSYYVMKSSKNYEAEGTASWYGTKFHKRNTSSGEKYDMLGMTAAHRTLPLPTYIEVTNTNNGRTIIVKVNDRGPFAENRLIDLSYAAAKKLGMIGHGTANVKVKAIDPDEFNHKSSTFDNFFFASKKQTEQTHEEFQAKQVEYARSKPYVPKHLAAANQSKGSNPVYLQVGAFSNKAHAEKLQKQLSAVVASSVKITQQHGASKLYRVQIGPIKDNVAVAKINKQLKSIGLTGKVMVV